MAVQIRFNKGPYSFSIDELIRIRNSDKKDDDNRGGYCQECWCFKCRSAERTEVARSILREVPQYIIDFSRAFKE